LSTNEVNKQMANVQNKNSYFMEWIRSYMQNKNYFVEWIPTT